MIIFSLITHDYISTVQFFNSVVVVVIIYVAIRIYTIYTLLQRVAFRHLQHAAVLYYQEEF